MVTLRAVWRALRVLLHVLHGMAIVSLRWARITAERRHGYIAWWAAKLLALMGVQVHVRADVGWRSGATLLVANHVSWLDILAIHAACPRARFVSKAEVRHWPLLGWLVGAVGTLFIERERKRDALRVVHLVAQALQAGDCVAVFPEGTTGAGWPLLPFHANLLQAAVATATPVQPVVLRYADAQHRYSPAVAWVGSTTLAQSLWRLLCSQGLRVIVQPLPPMGTAHADRRALAAHVQATIEAALPSV